MVDTVQGTLITPGTTLNLSNLTLQGGLVTSNVSLTTGTIVQTGMYTPDGTNLVLVSNSAQQINIAPSGVLSSLSNIQTTASLVATNLVGNGTITGAMVTVGNVAVNAGVAPTNGMYLPAANTLALASGSTQRLTISPTGNVGIGSTTPQQTLDVNGNVNVTNTVIMGSPFIRNRLINGAFDIWQRGTSFSNPTSSATSYTADRWSCFRGGFTTNITTTQLTGISQNGNNRNALRVQRTAGDTNASVMYAAQALESINSRDLAGQSVTISAWVRVGSNYSGGTITLSIFSGVGTDQNPTTGLSPSTSVVTITPTPTASFVRYVATGVVPSTCNQLEFLIYYSPTGTAGANDYFDLMDVQLEPGPVATPFERRQYQQELAMCQRYCCNVAVGSGVAINTTYVQLSVQYPVTMRTAPYGIAAPSGTARITDCIASDFTTASPAPTILNTDQNGARITINNFTGLTAGRYVMMLQSSGSAAPVQFNAEL